MNQQTPDYRSTITARYQRLSPSYRRVCDYIMRNYIVAAMSTAADVAAAAQVDTTTVVRCAQILGYKGWPELQAQLKAHALSEYQTATGAGIQNYIDALNAWQRYRDLHSISAQEPLVVAFAIDAAHAYADALLLTDHCLSQPSTVNQ